MLSKHFTFTFLLSLVHLFTNPFTCNNDVIMIVYITSLVILIQTVCENC